MPGTLNFNKVGKTIKIFAVAQLGMVAMLVYMAILLQEKLGRLGKENGFLQAVIATFVIQLALFYPINRFASREAERDLSLTAINLSNEELKALSKKKRFGDIIKSSVFCFFGAFIVMAPTDPTNALVVSAQSVLLFSFILTILTYLQCYNFAAKRLMKQERHATGLMPTLP
jgi:Sec-independent protein secretion pathway component TatC